MQHIRDLNRRLRVVSNTFDPWHAKIVQQDLSGEGLPCEDMHQTGIRRAGASAATYELIVEGRLHYHQDVIERHILNATIKSSGTEGGYYLTKRRRGRVMDAAMALSFSVYGTMVAVDTDTGPSVYEQRGIISY
jgi:phage terminase large subunit-like protein